MPNVNKLLPPVLLGFSILIFLVRTVWPASDRITQGFAAYYVASRVLLEGRVNELLYNDAAFRLEVERETFGQASDVYWANPPTTALLFIPIARFPPATARRLWTGIGLFFLALAIILSMVVFSPRPFRTAAVCITTSVFLLSAPLARNTEDGQAYIFILALMSLALFGLHRRIPWLTGLCLALALLLKASGIPLWILLALNGRWRLLGWAFFIFGALILTALPLTGIVSWQIFLFQAAPSFLRDPVIAVTSYQTVPGFLSHLFAYNAAWNPAPVVDSPFFALAAAGIISLLFVAVAGFNARGSAPERTFCIGLLLSVILIPAAEQYQYVLLFPAFMLAVYTSSNPFLPLLISAALIAAPFAYTSPVLSQGWLALLAYPRLYGAIILFFTLQLDSGTPRPNSLITA